MSDTATTVSQLNGWFKPKFGKFQDIIPEVAKFVGSIGPLVKAQKVGKDFEFPVELSLPQGVTYAAAGDGAFAFEDTIPGEMKNATIDGSQIVVTDILDYESAAKAKVWLERWAAQVLDEVAAAQPEFPEGMDGRAEDIWGPLLAVADAAGGTWPDRARAACRELALGKPDGGESLEDEFAEFAGSFGGL